MTESPNIVFLDANSLGRDEIDFSILSELGQVTLYDNTESAQLIERCKSAQIIISNKVKIEATHIEQLPALKMIQVAATGYNNVAVSAARDRGITVCNVSGYSTSSVAQHVFAMLLSYLNNCSLYYTESQSGVWSRQSSFSYWHGPIEELADETMGIFGFGKIGMAVAKIALAYDMKVLAVSKYPDKNQLTGVQFVDMDALLRSSDILSLHAPLNPLTKGVIDAHALGIMKKDAILINTSRGPLINEDDLYEALENDQISVALLDVLSQEPPPQDHPLLGVKNCFITPHQAWASLQSRKRLLQGISDNIRAFLSGTPVNVV